MDKRYLYLTEACPSTSYIAAMFHPTIGQRDHQSLSNAATPELGMIPPRIRVITGLHIAKGHDQQENTVGFIKLSTNQPSQRSPWDNHCMPAAKTTPSQPYAEGKTTR